jgi:hypothetical protein
MAVTYIDVPGIGRIPIDFANMDLGGVGIPSVAAPPATTAAPPATTAATAAAPVGLGARQSAWEGAAPQYAKPSLTPGLEPLTQGDVLGYQFVTNKGNPAGIGKKEAEGGDPNPSGFIPIIPGAQYRFVDEKGKNKVVYSGIGAEGLAEVYRLAQETSAKKGKKANWAVEVMEPGAEGWRRMADDDPAKGIGGALKTAVIGGLGFLAAGPLGAGLALGARAAGLDDVIMEYGLPIALSLTPLGPIGGAALGSAIGKAYTGGDLKEILTAAGLSAATAGALKVSGLDKTLAGALQDVPGVNDVVKGIGNIANQAYGNVAGNLVSQGATQAAANAAAQKVADEIVVNGVRGIVNAAGAGVGSLASGLGSNILSATSDLANQFAQQATQQQGLQDQFDQALGDDIVVTGSNTKVGRAATAMLANLPANHPDLKDLTPEEMKAAQDIVVEARKGVTPPAVSGIGGAGAGAVLDIGNQYPETVITAKPDQPIVLPVTPGSGMPAGGNQPTTTEPKKGMGTSDYIRLGLLGLSALGGAGGGGGGGALPGSGGPLDYTPLNRRPTTGIGGAGTEPAFDVFTYGQDLPEAQRGEFQFFQPYNLGTATAAPETPAAIPQNAIAGFNTYQDTLASQVAAGSITPAAAQQAAMDYAAGLGFTAGAPALAEGGEVNDDMVKHLVAYSQGSGHQGPGKVSGIGSGQEDLIPAWLSDGEYVWSAQDVADLGDGSTDEGVRRLDKMRQMVRKNAGRKEVKKIAKPQPGMDKMLKAVGGPV